MAKKTMTKRKKIKKVKKTSPRMSLKKSIKSKKNQTPSRKKKKVTSAKKKKVTPIPKGYHSITPYLIVNSALQAIDFYQKAFDAKVVMRMEHPGGKIGHAELKVGDAKIMLADEYPEMDAYGPEAYGGSPVGIHLYVKDVDAVVNRAINAGAKIKRAAENMFYGDRSASIEDPYGHKWYISTHIEDVSLSELKKRVKAMFNKNEE